MYAVVVTFFLIVPAGLALSWPFLLIYFSLLTGAAPATFGKGEHIAGDFGKMDLYAIRLLGLWIAALLVVLLNSERLTFYLGRYKFHLLFLSFCILSLLWAPSLLYGTRMIAKLTAPFIFLLLVLVVVQTYQQLQRIENVMLVSGSLAVLFEIGSWMAGFRFEGKSGLGIPGLGPAASSAHLAILSMLAFGSFRNSGSKTHLILTACFAGAAAAGFTRITIGGMFVGFSVIMFLSSRGILRYILPFAGMAALPAIFLFNDTLRYRMFKEGQIPSLDAMTSDPSVAIENVHGSGRFEAWENILDKFFLPNPLLGSGTGTTQHYLYTHPFIGLNVIHSEYIRILAELGLFGIVLLVLSFATYVLRLQATHKRSQDPYAKKYSLGALGGLCVYLVFMATDNAIDYVTSCGIFVFTMIAMTEKARDLELSAGAEQPVSLGNEMNAVVPWGKDLDVAPNESRRHPIIT
jgi:hypothetical protein